MHVTITFSFSNTFLLFWEFQFIFIRKTSIFLFTLSNYSNGSQTISIEHDICKHWLSTGVMLNWNSLTSIKYKKGLINCLLDRSNKICSSNEQKILEMEDLRNILLANNYPPLVIDKQFEKFEKYKQLNVDKIKNPDEKINSFRSRSLTTNPKQLHAKYKKQCEVTLVILIWE